MKPSPCRIATTPSWNPIDVDLGMGSCRVSDFSDVGTGAAVELCIQSPIAVIVKLAAITMAAGRYVPIDTNLPGSPIVFPVGVKMK